MREKRVFSKHGSAQRSMTTSSIAKNMDHDSCCWLLSINKLPNNSSLPLLFPLHFHHISILFFFMRASRCQCAHPRHISIDILHHTLGTQPHDYESTSRPSAEPQRLLSPTSPLKNKRGGKVSRL